MSTSENSSKENILDQIETLKSQVDMLYENLQNSQTQTQEENSQEENLNEGPEFEIQIQNDNEPEILEEPQTICVSFKPKKNL